MCTVTCIPTHKGWYITSNRDERILRKPALIPQHYTNNNHTLLYPKDADAGGTWIVMHSNGNAAVLLNGAFVKHIPQPPYRRSRGLVLIDIITDENPLQNFLEANLQGIEPFTLIILADKLLYECRWDGSMGYHKLLDGSLPHIWSSVTLYEDRIIRKREQWFRDWLIIHPTPEMNDIMHFHQFAGDGDTENDIRMNRSNEMLTVSITGMQIDSAKGNMFYHDLQHQLHAMQVISFNKQTVSR